MFITLILALVLGNSLSKPFTTSSEGFAFLSTAISALGYILLGVYALSLISKSLKWITLSTLPVMLTIIAFAVFTLSVSSQGGGRSVNGTHYKEYNLASYSKWMVHKVNDSSDWQTTYKANINSNNVCSDLITVHQSDTVDQFNVIKLSSLQSGCCIPPEECKFTYAHPTNWTEPVKNLSYSNTDCKTWSDDQSVLCYNCDSCKAGFLQDVKKRWFLAGILLLLAGSLEVVLYVTLTILCRD